MRSESESARLATLVAIIFLAAVAPAMFTLLAGAIRGQIDLRLVTFGVNYGIFLLSLCIGFCFGLPGRLNIAKWLRIVLMIAILVSGCVLLFELSELAEQRLAIKMNDGFLLFGATAGEIFRKSRFPSPLDSTPKPN